MPENRKKSTTNITDQPYPYNLLQATVQNTKADMPMNMTDDRIRGLQYAMSTLEPREYEILMYRYNSKMSPAAIGEIYNLSADAVRQVEYKAIRKLRTPSRWNYIKLGIVGYWQQRKRQYYEQGYRTGYLDGYRTGCKDEKEGRTQQHKDNPVLDLIIENLGVSNRAFQCLRHMGCSRIGDVVTKDYDTIIRTRNMGRKTMDEIARALHKQNLINTAWDQFIIVPDT